MELLEKIKDYIKKEKLIDKNDKLLLGCSGGPDSIFLLEMLLKVKKEYNLEVALCHIDHKLRGKESDGDREFVKELGVRHNLKVYIKEVDIKKYAKINKIGEEEAGRVVRYDFFQETLKEKNLEKIVLAHNKDDQVETFLFRLMRGSTLKGLEGIKNKRENIVRPILEIEKKDILKYLEKNKIRYQVDSSNLKSEYTRNKIRLNLIPELEREYNPKFKEKIYNLIEEIKEVNEARKINYNKYIIDNKIEIKSLNNLSNFNIKEVINEYLLKNQVDINKEKVEQITSILKKGGSKEIFLGKGLKLKKEYGRLYIVCDNKDKFYESKIKKLYIPGKVRYNNYIIVSKYVDGYKEKKNTIYLDIETKELLVRKRQDGDRIVINSKGQSKKVKSLLIDQKVPKEKRDTIPLVVSEKSEILWIAGIRGSFKYSSKDLKKKLIMLEIKEDTYSG